MEDRIGSDDVISKWPQPSGLSRASRLHVKNMPNILIGSFKGAKPYKNLRYAHRPYDDIVGSTRINPRQTMFEVAQCMTKNGNLILDFKRLRSYQWPLIQASTLSILLSDIMKM